MFDLVLRPKIGVIMVDQKDPPPGRQASNFMLVPKGLNRSPPCRRVGYQMALSSKDSDLLEVCFTFATLNVF